MLAYIEQIRLCQFILQIFRSPHKQNDNVYWNDVRKNRIRNIKDNLSSGSLHADDNIISKSNLSLLHMSIIHNKIELFTLAILFKADVNKQTNEGCTPTHLACALGRLRMLEDLIENGADMTAKDRDGRTPMDNAQFYDQSEIIDFLEKMIL